MLLQGRVAAITGGASGIGREAAGQFAREGARIAVLDLNLEQAQETVVSLPAVPAGPHLALEVDVTDEVSVKAAFAAILEQAGGADVLLNSAGIREIVNLFDISVEEWRRVLDVNLTGSFLCAREAARQMVSKGAGSIINISSVAGLLGFNDRPAYVTSKAGVVGLTKSLMKDLSPKGVRVNVVVPGLLRTPFTEHFYADKKWAAGIPDYVPLGRPGTASDIAKVALFLASDLAGFVTGAVIPVDGGFTAAGSFGKGTTVDAPGRHDDADEG